MMGLRSRSSRSESTTLSMLSRSFAQAAFFPHEEDEDEAEEEEEGDDGICRISIASLSRRAP
jgi:hypothetical protein